MTELYRRTRRGTFAIELALLLSIVATLVPIVWLFMNSFKFSRDIVNPGQFSTWTLHNYRTLFAPRSTFPDLFVNSLVVVVFTTALCLLVAMLAAYSLSKFQWPVWFTTGLLGLTVFIQLVPPVTLVPSFYVVLNNFQMYNSRIGLIFVNTLFYLPFAIFLLKVYFDSISNDLKEAALVDGATEAGVFWRIMVPLARPGIAAVVILVGILTWNEFLMALSLTSTPDAQTIPVGIATFIQQYQVRYGDMTAAAAIASLPIIVLAATAHRYIVAGLTGGAVKG